MPNLSTAKVLKALDVDLRQVALKAALQREIRKGSLAEDAQRIQNHHGPTIQTGDSQLQGGVVSSDPTITSIQQLTGQGATGGRPGPSTNPNGVMDKGNFGGQTDAGILNRNLRTGLYALIYSRYGQELSLTASRKENDELLAEQRGDVHGHQTTAEAMPEEPRKGMVAGA